MKKQIIILGLIGLLITGGLVTDNFLAPIPPNFIYAKHNNYFYQGTFDYCYEANNCYLKGELTCMMQDVEKCTPKACVEEKSPYQDYISQQKYLEQKRFSKDCLYAKIKAQEDLYFYDSKLRTSRKLTPTDTPEIITSEWFYNDFYYGGPFDVGSTKATLTKENQKYRASIGQNSEFITFIK